MNPVKLQFVHTYEERSGLTKRINPHLLPYLLDAVPNLLELNSDSVSAVLSLNIEGLIDVMRVHHPGDCVAFKYVQYESIKDHTDNSYKTRITLKSDIFRILESPVNHGKRMTFIGIEDEGDRLRSYSIIRDEKTKYILSANIVNTKPKKPLKLTG